MDTILTNACAERGWIEVYRLWLPDTYELSQRPGRSEHDGLSPFPGSNDRRPSFSVNGMNGLWNDQHMRDRLVGIPRSGGNIVNFVAFMRATPDEHGRLHADFDAAEREIRVTLGLVRQIDVQWYEACRMRLATVNNPYVQEWAPYRPWVLEQMQKAGLGWDVETNRLVIPIRDKAGILVNCKMYRPGPGSGVKMTWKQEGVGPQNLPFPFEVAWPTKKAFWFVEGESDAITLLSYGIYACTGTMGANAMPFMGVAGNEFCLGRDIVVCGDPDTAGEAYAARAVAMFQPFASSLRQVRVPEWDGMPPKRDITDWVMKMRRDGMERADIIQAIRGLAAVAEPVGAEARYDSEPTEMRFDDALNVNNYNRRFLTDLRVISTSSSRHLVPGNMELRCREDKSYCRECAMRTRGGVWNRSLDHRSQTALDAAMADTDKQFRMIKRHFGIPEQCPSVTATVQTVYDVQIVQAAPPQTSSNLDSLTAEDAYSRRTELFIMSRHGKTVEPGFDYCARGFMYPVGKNQKSVMLVDDIEPIEGESKGQNLTREQCERLRRVFSPPGMTVMESLYHSAADLASSVTGIMGRADLHLLYRAVFHSAISFDFAGEKVSRGWIEAFVVGDTRCGKSAAFKAMSNWYGAGLMVDCKMQSVPGLLGAVETSAITGERYVLPGIVPLNDMRGPICFDEFTGPKHGRAQLMEAMSSTRAEGVVRINKAAHASFNARVRSMWLANPGEGRLLNDIPGFGVERIKWLVGQPEDIARFDAAMAVTQADVPIDVLMSPVVLTEPRVPKEDARLLLEWSRARKPTDFVWEDDAVRAVKIIVRTMTDEYEQSIPLVEPATQRLKLAKFAVANALSTFSSPDGKIVVVRAAHVIAALEMFRLWYNKKCFGYNAYSERQRINHSIRDPDGVRTLLEAEFGEGMIQCLHNLQGVTSFSEATFRIMCPVRIDNATGILRNLSQNRCIEPDGMKNMFRLTPSFVSWISDYLKSGEPRPPKEQEDAEESRTV